MTDVIAQHISRYVLDGSDDDLKASAANLRFPGRSSPVRHRPDGHPTGMARH